MVVQTLNMGPNSQSAHLAVTHKQQPDAVNDLQHLVNRRDVERIIGVVAGYDLRNQRQSQRIQRRHHDFDLAQARIIFTVPKLKQAFFSASVETRNRRRIQAHPFRRQFVHSQMVRPRSVSIACQALTVLKHRDEVTLTASKKAVA